MNRTAYDAALEAHTTQFPDHDVVHTVTAAPGTGHGLWCRTCSKSIYDDSRILTIDEVR